MPIPPNRNIGDAGHVNDHNDISSMLANAAYLDGNNIEDDTGNVFVDKTKLAYLDSTTLEKSDGTDLANLGAWVSYTPTIAQGSATNISKTILIAKYCQIGKTIHARVSVTITGTGQANQMITFTLPVTAASTGTGYDVIGQGTLYNGSRYKFFVQFPSDATKVRFAPTNTTGDDVLGANVFTAALVNGNSFDFSCTYEAS